jgi:hypothetical protein
MCAQMYGTLWFCAYIFCQCKLTTTLYGVFIFYRKNVVTPIQLCIILYIEDLAFETLYKDLLLEIWTALGPKKPIKTSSVWRLGIRHS